MRPCVLLLLLSACAPAPARVDSPPGPASTSPDATSTAALSADAAPTGGELPKAHGSPPLFEYQKGSDRFTFSAPSHVRLVRNGHPPCTSELPEGGNMYSGGDVLDAYADADVQNALAEDAHFRAAMPAKLSATDPAGAIHWLSDAPEANPPAGVTRFHDVLEVILLNRKLTCP